MNLTMLLTPKTTAGAPVPELITHMLEITAVARPISLAVIHCSASPAQVRYRPMQLIRDHLGRGFTHAGYHYYITREGNLYGLRPLSIVGAHARGHNTGSIGICYEGGLDRLGSPADTRTPAQRQMMSQLLGRLRELYPDLRVVGHRDLSPDRNGDGKVTPDEWNKICPCFDAKLLN